VGAWGSFGVYCDFSDSAKILIIGLYELSQWPTFCVGLGIPHCYHENFLEISSNLVLMLINLLKGP